MTSTPRPAGLDALLGHVADVLAETRAQRTPHRTAQRASLAGALASYADHLADTMRAQFVAGLPEQRAGLARAADLLNLHRDQLLTGRTTRDTDHAIDAILAVLTAGGIIGEQQHDQAEAEQPTPPAVGDTYRKTAEPDAGRIVTVEKVWTAEDGHTAVAYQWDDPRASYAGSACPLDVFLAAYEPATEPGDVDDQAATLDTLLAQLDAVGIVVVRRGQEHDDHTDYQVDARYRGIPTAAFVDVLDDLSDHLDPEPTNPTAALLAEAFAAALTGKGAQQP